MNFLRRLLNKKEVNLGIVSFGYKGKKWHW